MRKRNILGIILGVLLIAAVVAPWKKWVEDGLKTALAERGIAAEFQVSALDLHGITLTGLTIGESTPLRLDSLRIDYALLSLLHGEVDALRADRLDAKVNTIKIHLRNVLFTRDGRWSIASLDMENAPLSIPPLTGSGTWLRDGQDIILAGKLQSAGKAYMASFAVEYKKDLAHSALKVHQAQLPLYGGVVTLGETAFPLAMNHPVKLTLQVKHIALDAVLSALTNKAATASGAISGAVPILIGGKSPLIIKNGILEAEAPGIVNVPETLSGENPELALLKTLLSNFHYTRLSITLNSDENNKLVANLQIEGVNPDAYKNRPVKLHVHLTGDVLSLVQQSILPMNDPSQFLK